MYVGAIDHNVGGLPNKIDWVVVLVMITDGLVYRIWF